ncbi:MAG: cytochrome C assembly protein, partial [Deltaproteobacteria bacterium]|nr:cytochrome C assembly protein [Deltaproteobacteria bacterium]
MKLKLEYFAPLVMLLWLVGSLLLHFSPRKVCRLGRGLVWAGVLTLGLFICLLWLELGHPPLRTIGETRLWYSLLLSLTGVIGFVYWRILWLQSCSLAMAALFLGLNLAYPEMLERVLMPALQSPWFVPHVV